MPIYIRFCSSSESSCDMQQSLTSCGVLKLFIPFFQHVILSMSLGMPNNKLKIFKNNTMGGSIFEFRIKGNTALFLYWINWSEHFFKTLMNNFHLIFSEITLFVSYTFTWSPSSFGSNCLYFLGDIPIPSLGKTNCF